MQIYSSLVGEQDRATMLEGLWVSGDALHRDLATMTQRIRLLGFNAVRLPFSMKDIFNLPPKYALSHFVTPNILTKFA